MKHAYTIVKKNRPFLFLELPGFPLFKKNPQFILTEARKEEINLYLKDTFEVEKPFLQTKYNLGQLSQESGFSRNVISAFLNQELDCCFNDYINLLRIKYCRELMAEGYAHQLALEGLAERCGFYNRNTFTTAFKKFTGLTPSQYIKLHYKKVIFHEKS
jgi:AraC-like DNA-binding protein